MIRRRLAVAAVLVAAAVALVIAGLTVPTESDGAPDPVGCTGYPEPRVWQEAQGWWQPPGSEDLGHVHIGTCFPRTHNPDGSPVKVTGSITLDTVVKLHDNPGRLDFVRVHLLDAAGFNQQIFRVDIDEYCPTNDCTWNVPVTFDTAASHNDGYQNVRLAAIVQHADGTKDFGGTEWQLYLSNGKPLRHQKQDAAGNPLPRLRTEGWYTGALYTTAELRSWLPYTVSGVWNPQTRFAPGAGGKDVARSFASIDPSFHAVPVNPGQVVLDRTGPYTGPLSIDTRTLSNGPHKLFMRADSPCDGTAGNDCGVKPGGGSNNVATNSGVSVTTFTVAN